MLLKKWRVATVTIRFPETRAGGDGHPTVDWQSQSMSGREHARIPSSILASPGGKSVIDSTSPERESRLVSYSDYATLANSIAPERRVMRGSLLALVLKCQQKKMRAPNR